MSEKVLPATGALESKLCKKGHLESLRDLSAIHGVAVVLCEPSSNPALRQLSLVVCPLVGNDVATAHASDGDQHLRGTH